MVELKLFAVLKIILLINLQSVPPEVERNLWSAVSSVKPLISKTVEAYGLTNLTEEEVRYSSHDYRKIKLIIQAATKRNWFTYTVTEYLPRSLV